MAIVEKFDRLYSMRAQQKFGDCVKHPITSQTYAAQKAKFPMAGIYQIKHTRKGVAISREKIYRPTNPRTEKQQAWRAIFRAGVLEWQALDNEAKKFYNLLAYPLHFEGFNYFMRRYLILHKN